MTMDHQVIYDYIITDYNYDYNDLAGSHGGYGHKKKKKKKKTRKKVPKLLFGFSFNSHLIFSN